MEEDLESKIDKGKSSLKRHGLNKSDRELCWIARDNFWKCMISNDTYDRLQMNENKCTVERQPFLESCPPTWVAHFDGKYIFGKFARMAKNMDLDILDKQYMEGRPLNLEECKIKS